MTSCRFCSYGNRKRSRIDEKRTVANKEEKRERGMETNGTEIWRGEEIEDTHVDLFPPSLPVKETRTEVQSQWHRE